MTQDYQLLEELDQLSDSRCWLALRPNAVPRVVEARIRWHPDQPPVLPVRERAAQLLNHPNLLRYHGSSQTNDNRLITFLDYTEARSLRDILYVHDGDRWSTPQGQLEAVALMIQACQGLDHLYQGLGGQVVAYQDARLRPDAGRRRGGLGVVGTGLHERCLLQI